MATNLAIDDRLLEEVMRAGGHKSEIAAITEALEEYVRHRSQEEILKLFGTIDYDPDYDVKEQRARL